MAKKPTKRSTDAQVKLAIAWAGGAKTEATISGNGTLNINMFNGVPFATISVLEVECPHCRFITQALNEAEKEIERLTSDEKPVDIEEP